MFDGKPLNYYFENAFKLFARAVTMNSKNTIALNSIAVLLYDHYQKAQDKDYLFNLLVAVFMEYLEKKMNYYR